MHYEFTVNEKEKMNPFVEFYSQHKISPVRQDIGTIDMHYKRREKLYRMLGIPTIVFQNKTILEVGPGSGYNTLAFFKWGAKVDLVEPNETGRKEMMVLFGNRGAEQYKIYPCLIEEASLDHQYPIVVAEGFLHLLDNWQEIMNKLQSLCADGGIIVVSCSDDMGMFVERIKRVIAHFISKDISDFDTKVEFLSNIFSPQLKSLEGMSRRTEDWVKDQLLNPAWHNNGLTMSDVISYLNKDFDVLGASQNIFVDYSWYKDIAYDYKMDYLRQYKLKRHNFILAGMTESYLSEADSMALEKHIATLKKLGIEYEKSYQDKIILEIIRCLNELLLISLRVDARLDKFVKDTIIILDKIRHSEVDFHEYPDFFNAFGKSQQYISIIKKAK